MHSLARLIIATWVLYGNTVVLYAQSSCADLISYTYDRNYRVGSFRVDFPKASNDTFVQVVVYVGDECKRGLCSLLANTSREMAREVYRDSKEVPYLIHSQNTAQNVTVEGVVLKTSSNCRVLCGRESQNSRVLRYTLYPFGREDTVEPECSLIKASYYGDPDCGVVSNKTEVKRYVFKGEEIKRGSWPWLVAIYRSTDEGSKFICGGTLISQRVVLTAAHCLFEDDNELNPEDFLLYLGRHNRLNEFEEGYVKYEVGLTQMHWDYRYEEISFDSDIALLYTDRDVEYTDFIRPACLWDDKEPIEDLVSQKGVIVGWGTDETGTTSAVPKRVTGVIASHRECYDSNPVFVGISTKRNFCAGWRDGSGPCTGDSGGTFMIYASGRWIVRGVVAGSLGGVQEFCDLSQFVVYTDVSKYRNWIVDGLPRFTSTPTTIPTPVTTKAIVTAVTTQANPTLFRLTTTPRTIPTRSTTKAIITTVATVAIPTLPLTEAYFNERTTSAPKQENDAECGVVSSNLDWDGSWPWDVKLYFSNNFFPGTLISRTAVIATGYLIEKFKPPKIAIRGGAYDKFRWVTLATEYYIYPENEKNNIAIIKTEKINFPDFIIPACLWTGSAEIEDIVGREIQMSCASQLDDPNSKWINKVIEQEECEKAYTDLSVEKPENTFCAGPADYSGLCSPALGSGSFMYERGKWMLRGIMSGYVWVRGTDNVNVDNYIDIFPFLPWIKQYLN